MREISWSHNLAIFSRCKTMEEREFYIKLTKFAPDISNTFRDSYVFNFFDLKDKLNECDIKIEIINTLNPIEDQCEIDVEQIFPVLFNPIQLYKIPSK